MYLKKFNDLIAIWGILAFVVTASGLRAEEREIIEGELFPQVQQFQLHNGMEVIVVPDNRSPIVTHMVWYRVGSADEEPGKSGLAHFLEHLLFKGTEKFPGNAIDRSVKQIGGSHNAFTSYDYTGYFQRVTRDHLALMMEIEADRMMNVRFTEEDMDVERRVVLEQRARSIETNPGSQLGAAISLSLWKNHPYRRPIIGWRHEIESVTRDDAFAFYERYYTPANAVLVVAGDVTVDQVKALAATTYGALENRSVRAERKRPSEPADLLARRQVITVRHPQISRDSFSMTFRVPSFNTAQPGEFEALVMLGEVLSGTTRSRIYRDLVIERQMATSAGASYSSQAMDDTRFTLYGTPKEGISLEAIEQELLAAVQRVAKEGVTEEELRRARNRLFASTIYAQDNASGLARMFGRIFTIGGTMDGVRSWPDRMKAVTSEDVKAVAAKFFDPERAIVGHLRKPAESASDASGDQS